MSVSALDSQVLRNILETEDARSIFTDEAYMKRWIEVESALARAQSTLGVNPIEAGTTITAETSVEKINFEKLPEKPDIGGYPVLPLVRQLTEMMTDAEQAKHIHYTRYHRLLVAGRTHLQHALPISWGYKCAVYISGFQRHLERLNEIEDQCLLIQFGGAVGTLASLGSDDTGIRVRRQLAKELGLKDSSITWHVARDHMAEIVNFLGLADGSLGKIALDIIIMSSNELGDVSEPFAPHGGASSIIPQKRNPISSEVILAASKILRSNASLALDAMVSDFERASGPWHLERVCIPDSFVVCCGAMHRANFTHSGLVVNFDAMLTNLLLTDWLIVGRQHTHDTVYEACKTSIEKKTALFDFLHNDEKIKWKIGKKTLKGL